jgi:hypothetical protein
MAEKELQEFEDKLDTINQLKKTAMEREEYEAAHKCKVAAARVEESILPTSQHLCDNVNYVSTLPCNVETLLTLAHKIIMSSCTTA